ncbi:hypothetical protein GCM10010195_06380 [Kitasatospora griseola]|nr:hypothetical protein GCM10010195_06380 [Kitasatospora griseola]
MRDADPVLTECLLALAVLRGTATTTRGAELSGRSVFPAGVVAVAAVPADGWQFAQTIATYTLLGF